MKEVEKEENNDDKEREACLPQEKIHHKSWLNGDADDNFIVHHEHTNL